MSQKTANGKSFFDQLNKSKTIAICTAGDQKALNAGVALSLFIKEKYKKTPFVVYAGDLEPVDTIYSEYAEIRETLSNKKLKIIIDYKNTDINSLQWEKTDDHKLVMELKPVNRSFDPKNIQFETTGDDVDMIIMVGISDPKELGDFYEKNKKDIEESYIVNIDTNKSNKRYGHINIVYPESDSIISLILRKFADWKYTPNAVISTILLYGLHKTAEVEKPGLEIEVDASR